MNSILAKMAVQISANTAEFAKGINQANGTLNSFAKNIMGIAGTIGLAFGVQQVASFTIEISKLAGEFEAVNSAFSRLKDSKQLLEDLKEATNGTVSELELMKRAVQASNFDISLKALPRLLEFATLRAQQTGQSIDYLVDSIVTGIGRKSKLILDNLGISAVQLTEALGGASAASSTIGEVADAVGKIAEKNLKNMAGFADTAKASFDQLTASWDNFKVSLGTAINEGGGAGLAKDAARIMDVLSSKTLGWTQKVGILLTTFDNAGISEKLDEWNKKMEPIIQKQDFLNKWKAQELINQYGGISKAIDALGQEWAAVYDIANKPEILAILGQRLKEANDNIQRGLDDDAAAAKRFADQLEHARLVAIEFNKLKKPEVKPNEGINSESLLPFQVSEIPEKVSSPFGVIFNKTESDKALAEMEAFASNYQDISNSILSINGAISKSYIDLGMDILSAVGSAIGGGEKLGMGLLKSLANFGQKYGAQLIALGVARVAEGVLTENPDAVRKGLTGIAAGGALVIASSALSSAVSSSSSAGRSSASVGGGAGARDGRVGNTQNSININVNGKLVAEGNQLVALLATTQQYNYQTKG